MTQAQTREQKERFIDDKSIDQHKSARMVRVFICSPYSGDVNANVLYARAAMRHALLKGESPFVPHLLYTQPKVLNDSITEERELGIKAGHAFLAGALHTKAMGMDFLGVELLAVYYDRGISQGMMQDMQYASNAGVPLEFRSLKGREDNRLWGMEIQERGITSMWLDEQDRIEAEK